MSHSILLTRKKTINSYNVIKKLSKLICLMAFFVGSSQVFAQGVLSSPIFSENFGTLANGTTLTTSNTAFSYVRVGTSSSGTPPNNIIAKNPSSFTASSALIGAKGGSISTIDKTGLTSFGSGTLTFKFKTPSSLTSAVMLSAVGAGASFGSSNGFTGGQLSAGFQVTGTSLQVRAGGAWSSALTVSTSTAYAVTIIFNNTAGSLSYGSGYTLASNKFHLWIDGTYIGEYNAATSSLAASAFRIYTSTAEFELDDIAVYNTMPAISSSPTILGSATTSAFTMTYGTASTAQTFTISGSNLTDSLKAIAPVGFEVSKDSSNYYDSVSFAQSSGAVSARLSIRMKATDTVNGLYNSKSIVLKSTGATSININTPSSGNSVSAKALTITGLSASNKNYDGNTSVSVTGTPIYSGLVNAESFSVFGTVSWTFADSLVGSNKTLTRIGIFLVPSSNYTLTQPVLTASIGAVVPGTPQIGVAVAGNTQATVSFTAPSFTGGATITGYSVVADPGGITANGTVSPITVTGLANETAYTFTVYATNSVGNGTSSATSNSVTPTSDPIAPGVPTSVSAVAGNGQATILFTAPATDGGSTIISYTVTSNPGGLTLNGTTSPITLTGLTNGTEYTFTVYATNSAGNSLQSSSSNSVTPATISDAPSISSITLGNRQLTVNFTAPINNGGLAITNYQYSIDTGRTFIVCSPAQASSPIVIKGLNNGTSYSVVIAAINAVGVGASSAYTSATPANTAGSPTITDITVGNSSLSINFTAPVSDSGSAITNYKYSIDGGTNYAACSPAQTTGPIVVNGLTNGVNYTVKLRAVNAIGDGVASASASAMPVLPAPVARTANSVTSTSFVANWDSVPGATSYRLDVSTNSNFPLIAKLSENFSGFTTSGGTADRSSSLNTYTQTTGWTGTAVYENAGQIKLGSSSAAGSIVTPTIDLTSSNGTCTFSFDLLKFGSDNTFVQVFVSTNNGTSYTQVGSDIAIPSTITTQTFNISGASSTTKIKIAAKSATNNRYYLDNIQVSTSNNLPNYNDLTVSSALQNVSGLVNGTTYYYRVRAYSTTNTSINSNVITVTTNINIPPVLTAQQNASVDSSFNISFTEDSVWRNSITAVKVDGVTIPSSAYVLSSASQITFLPSAVAALQTAGNKTIVITATDYRNDTIVQSLAIGIASKLVINTQPAAPLTNGGLLSVQPKVAVTDQYGNKTLTTTNISAAVGIGNWTLNGTTVILADTGMASFNGLSATSLGPVAGATISFSAYGLTGVTSNTFNLLAPPPPVLTAALGANVDTAFNITFTDNSRWRDSITSIKVGASTLSNTAYSIVSGLITFLPSASTLLQSSGSKTIVVISAGYKNDTLIQAIAAGMATKLGMNTQPTAPSVNGGALAAQPKVNVQDQYGNTTSSTAIVTATADSMTWTLNGTTSVAATAGVTTFAGLTASSAAAVSSAKIVFSSPGLTSVTSSAFVLPPPPPLNDLCANAIIISVNGALTSGSMVAASNTSNTFTYASTKTDVWYKFVPDVTGNDTVSLTFTSATNRDIDLDVFNTANCPTTGTANFISHGSTTTETIIGAVTAGTTYYIRVIDFGTANGGTFNISVKGPATPTITTSGSLSAFTSTFGTVSAAQSVSVSGSGLVASITATAPTGFELSRDGGNTYKDTVNFAQSSGNVSGTLYIRLKATALVGTYDSKNIVLTSTSASAVNISTTSSGNIVSAVVPSAPRIDTAVAGNSQVDIVFSAPTSNGGSAITSYTITSNPDSISLTTTSSPITLSGLTNGTAYTFTIVATNIAGNSAPSAASTSVTPTADPVVPSAPIIGTASAGNATATITFTAPSSDGGSPITSYTAVSNPGNITATINQSASGSITVTGLNNGTAYTFTVYATNGIGNSLSSSASNSVTPKTTASAPVINSITIGNKQLSVLFAAPSSNGGVTLTNYKYSIDGGVSFTACSPVQTAGSIVITGLTNGTSYDVQILAVNSMGDGAASSTVSAIPATKPGAPAITSITPGNTQLSVAFTAPSSDSGSAITNYKYSTNNGTSYIACSPAQTTSPIVITGLTNATSYIVKILAVNAMGDGTASTSMTGTPRKAEPIVQPTSLVLSSVTLNSMDLAFTAASGTPDGYLVVRSSIDTLSALPADGTVYTAGISLGGGTVVASGTTISAIANTVLTSGTRYYFFVFAYNNATTLRDYLTTNPLTGNAITLSAAPVPTASNNSGFGFDVSWPAVTSAISYELSVSTNSGFTSMVAGYDSINLTALTQSITGLQAGTIYYFRVKAVNASGSSAYGSGNATTLALVPPNATAATAVSASSFIANWDSVPGATSYRLDVSKSPTFGTTSTATLSEGFEIGLLGSYVTSNLTLSSGSWAFVDGGLKVTTSNSGTSACQIKASTGTITSPALNNIGTFSFYAKSPNGASTLTIKKIVNGVTSTITTKTTTTSYAQYSIPVNDTSSNIKLVISNGSNYTYIDDISIVYINSIPSFVNGYQNLTVNGLSQLVLGLRNATNYYYRVRAYSANSTSTNSNLISVLTDSTISISPFLVADTTATVDTAFNVSFIEDPNWRDALAGITINGVSIADSAYSKTNAGQITFTPALTQLLQTPGTKTLVFLASGYTNDTLSQIIKAGVPNKLAITVQPTAPSVNGGALAAQPKVNVQDQYGNTTSSTAIVTATADSTMWTLNGTTSVAASAGVTTFAGLTASSAAAVSSAKIVFSSPGLTSVTSNAFAIPTPPPANDNCLGAISLTANTGAVTGVFTNATPMTSATKNDLFYSFTPMITGSFTITINSFSAAGDKDLYVYATCPSTYTTSGTNLIVKATTNSITSETVTATLTAGTTYKIMVQDFDAVGGTFNIAITGAAIYFSKSSGTLNNLSSWGTNPDGSGTGPISFTAANQAFVIKNNPAPTIDSVWIVSGANSKIILGDTINTCNFTIPPAYALTGTIDVTSNAILTIQNTTNPTFGSLSVMGTVDFASVSSQTIPSTNYGNITNTGNGPRVLASSGTIGVAGNYSPTSGAITTTGSTINFNGTVAQTITGSNYNNITTSNSAGCTTAGNVVLGNILTVNQNLTIGSGSTLTITTGDSVIIAASKKLTVSSTGTIQNNSTRIFNFNTTGSMIVNGVYVHNANSQTIPLSTYATYGIGSIIKVGDGGLNDTSVVPILPSNAYDVIWNTPALNRSSQFIPTTCNLNNLTIVNTGTANIFIGSAATARTLNIAGDLSINGGTLSLVANGTTNSPATANQTANIAGNLIVNNGKFYISGNIGSIGKATLSLKGNLHHSGGIFGKMADTATAANVILNGTANQTISTIGLSNKVNIKMNNSSGVTLNTDVTVADTLTFISGKIITGNNKLISTGTILGAGDGTGWVAGNLNKKISNTGIKNFEIGETNYYRPVSINITAIVDTGSITAFVSQQYNNHPSLNSSNISISKTLKRYFNLTKSNTLAVTYNALFNYNAADISAVFDTSKLIVGNYNSSWTYPTIGSKTNTSIQIVNTNTFGDFAIGEANQFDSINLQVKAFLEGYYLGAAGLMTATLNNPDLDLNGPISNDATATDSIIISLWKPDSLTNPTPAYSSKTILHTNGDAFLSLSKTRFLGNSYYISINHRNSIETWSAAPVPLSSNSTSYDFTTSASQAYGDGSNPPMKYMGNGVYAIYGGDVNQDGSVDAYDMQPTENDASNFMFGYNVTDSNGDGASDAYDMQLLENNSSLFLYYSRPF